MKPKTYKELLGPAMEITDQAEADEYFEELVRYNMQFSQSREEAAEIVRANLGYYVGYYDSETRLRVERLFCCAHPVFGKADDGEPTADEALAAGIAAGQQKDSRCELGEGNGG
jgi:hypothetical protein